MEQLDREMRAVASYNRLPALHPGGASDGGGRLRACPGQVRRARGPDAKLGALPPADPLRQVAELDPPRRLTATTGWRWLGAQALRLSGVGGTPSKSASTCCCPRGRGAIG